ncbi:hypothetical protein OCA08_13925 [Bacillus cereus]|nr:hypothetical protein [Bacillus cereus]
MDLVLNELSHKTYLGDVESAKKLMNEFIKVLVLINSKGIQPKLRMKTDIYNLYLTQEYPLTKWINDRTVDLDKRRLIMSIITQFPFIDKELESIIYDKVLASDFKFENEVVEGLGIAYLLDSIAISLLMDDRWNTAYLSLQMEFIDEEAETFTENIDIRHISTPIHLTEHEDWISSTRLKNIKTGKELWRKKSTLFPSLVFCEHIEEQITALHEGQTLFKQILKRLFQLETYFFNWNSGPFLPEKIGSKVTVESQVTLTKYENEHTFLCPDGKERLFSWHSRMTPFAQRLFFYPCENTRNCFIGHIGKKLPTVTYS